MQPGKKPRGEKRLRKKQPAQKRREKTASRSRRAGAAAATRQRRLRMYHFDLGNSSEGPVGACIAVAAHTAEEAVRKAQNVFGGGLDGVGLDYLIEVFDERVHPDEYCRVYLNPDALRIRDIDEEYEAAPWDE
jgi:hypothetical protein